MGFTKTVAAVALLLAVPVTMGLAGGGGAPTDGELGELEKVVKLVKKVYKGASEPESTILMAELAIFDLGKKEKIRDAPARLEKILAQVEHRPLRNFTHMMIAASYGEQNNPLKAAAQLEVMVAENAKLLGAPKAPEAPRAPEALPEAPLPPDDGTGPR